MTVLTAPGTPQDWADVRDLCCAYLDHLEAADPDARDVLAALYPQDKRTALLADLPQLHSPPDAMCLLARGAYGDPIGTGGFIRLSPTTAEMKRVYVTPAGQGRGLGRRLVTTLIEGARAAGYRHMVLDTMHFLTPAIRLYESLGFTPHPGYLPDHAALGPLVRCFEKDLTT